MENHLKVEFLIKLRSEILTRKPTVLQFTCCTVDTDSWSDRCRLFNRWVTLSVDMHSCIRVQVLGVPSEGAKGQRSFPCGWVMSWGEGGGVGGFIHKPTFRSFIHIISHTSRDEFDSFERLVWLKLLYCCKLTLSESRGSDRSRTGSWQV